MREEKENKKFYVQKVSLSNIRSPHCANTSERERERKRGEEWVGGEGEGAFGGRKNIEVNQISLDFTFLNNGSNILAFVPALLPSRLLFVSLNGRFLFKQRQEEEEEREGTDRGKTTNTQMKTYNKAFI